MPSAAELDDAIAKVATKEFTDTSTLPEAGIQSLSLLRLVVDLLPDDDAEIDVTKLGQIKTVGDLKAWLVELVGTAS
jgi:acyl carrier protein